MNSTVAMNNFKTVLLLGGMMGLFVAVGGAMGGMNGMIIGLLFGGVGNLIAYWFSDKIAIASMRGRELTPETGGSLYRMIEELSAEAGLPMPRVYLCPQGGPNAFATGRSPRMAAVAFTQGAIDLLSPEELRGVAAHELAHVKNRDTLTSTIAATIAGVLAFIAQWGLFLGMGNNREGSNPLVFLVVVIVGAVGAAVLKAMISRSREFVADADGARIAGSPHGLMSALQKLEAYSRRVPLVQPNPAMNNMFIIEPIASNLRSGNTLGRLFATHPPTEERLAALAKLA